MDAIRRRWGIFAAAAVMFFITFMIGGKASSPYTIFWGYVVYMAYKGDIKAISGYLKFLIILNVVVLCGVFFLTDPSSDIWRWTGWRSKEVLGVVVGIPLAVKLIMYLYINTQLEDSNLQNSTPKDSNSYVVSMGAQEVNKAVSSTTQTYRASSGRDYSMEDAYATCATHNASKPLEDAPTISAKENSMEGAYSAVASSQRPIPLDPRALKTREKSIVEKEPDDDFVYELALDEYEGPQRKRGLWAKLCADLDGDEEKIRSHYLKVRANQIRNEMIADAQARAAQTELDSELQQEEMSAQKASNNTTALKSQIQFIDSSQDELLKSLLPLAERLWFEGKDRKYIKDYILSQGLKEEKAEFLLNAVFGK